MNPIIKNILAVIAGIVIGSMVNMGIIMVSGSIIPPPQGADVTTMEGLKASMHLFGPQHFYFSFFSTCAWHVRRCFSSRTHSCQP